MHSLRAKTARRHGSRKGHGIGAVDWIACSLAGLLLISATACAPAAGSSPAAPAAAVESSAASASAAPAATATLSETDAAPLDPESTPGVGLSGVSAPHQQPAFASKARDVLATLPIKGRAPKTGYSRDQFGQAWADVDSNGCDTRNDVLRRDLTAIALKPGSQDCVVLSGVLNDPYTAALINFLRGNATSTAVQIDHVVALSDAWQKGAQQLSAAQRLSFANDPLNLLAVDGPSNLKKSDGDAATWLPPNGSYRCAYVARQVSVKSSYSLWATQAEHDAMAGVLAGCPDTGAPTSQTPTSQELPLPPAQAAPPAVQPAPAPAPAPAPPAVPVPAAAYYANCAAARAAGAAPLHAGQPGYRNAMDGDSDGVACE